MSALESILADVFKAEGLADYRGLAERAMKDVEMQRRNELIYALRAGHTIKEISDRTGLSEQRIKQIQKEQLTIKRSTSNAG